MRYHHLDEALDLFKKIGAYVECEVRRNKIAILIKYNGKQRQLFTSKTPSDGNVSRAIVRDARNLIIEMQK